MSRWIPATRPPKVTGFYVAAITYRECDCEPDSDALWYSPREGWQKPWGSIVTHWQPLPRPPRDRKKARKR